MSGRLWLTIVCGLSFLIFVITVCQIIYVKKDIFSGSEIVSIINIVLLIISNVMTFYFTKTGEDVTAEKAKTYDLIKEQLAKTISSNEDEPQLSKPVNETES